MSDPNIAYTPIYSDLGRISNRVPQIDDQMTPQIEAYMQYIDSKINNKLRSVLGQTDENFFQILLPLTGPIDVIDFQNEQVTLHSDFEINMSADNCIIAMYRSDTAENTEKVIHAEEELMNIIEHKYGSAVSTDQDFTTDFLASNKLMLENGTVFSLEGNSGILLLDQRVFNAFNGSSPDSRVIFVPREQFT